MQIYERYKHHRTARLKDQRASLLAPDFSGPSIDTTLRSLLLDSPKGYADPRNNLVFWARPPRRIQTLIASVQNVLREVIPDEMEMWTVPPGNLHMTVLELAHSMTGTDGENKMHGLIRNLEENGTAHEILSVPVSAWEMGGKAARLARPMVVYDPAAVAVSFLPVVAGSIDRDGTGSPFKNASEYTYHHVRRDCWNIASSAIPVASRYVVPSAHLTVARFVGKDGINAQRMRELLERIDSLNGQLEEIDMESRQHEWVVGEERPMELRAGSCWYGAGGWSQAQGSVVRVE